MHLVSCRHSTSGLIALMNFATRLMRRRTELIFQVVRERRMKAEKDARLRLAIKDDFSAKVPEVWIIRARPGGPQPGGKVCSVMSILNMPGSILFEESRL